MGDIDEELKSLPGFLLRRSRQISAAILVAEFGVLDITPSQFAVLSVVDAMAGRDQITLANAACFDQSTMTLIVNNLESRGLIERQRDPSDKRRKILTITPRGRDVLEEAKKHSERAKNRQLAIFSTKEASTFMRLLRQYVETLECDVEEAGEVY